MVVNMKIKTIFHVFLMLLIIMSYVTAQKPPLGLSSSKSVYTLGDNILIYADIYNINPYQTTALIETSLRDEKGNYPIAITPFEFQLNSNESKKVLLYNITVDEDMPSDRYIVNARLLFNREEITTQVLEFNVEGTFEEMQVVINTCKDQACAEKSKIFIKNENIYLDYGSDVAEPTITASLTYPDGNVQSAALPLSIEADQIGTYVLQATASKHGYKTVSKREQFAVVAQQAQIQSASMCNANGICGIGENYQNCPLDCASGSADSYCDAASDGKCDPDCIVGDADCEKGNENYIIIGIAIAAMAMIFFVFMKKRASRAMS